MPPPGRGVRISGRGRPGRRGRMGPMLRRHRMLLGLCALGYYVGAFALFLFCYWYLGCVESPPREPPSVHTRIEFIAESPHYSVPAAFGAAVVVATVLGCRAARRGGGWPHWPALVSGIGEAAFLTALVFAFLGLSASMKVIVMLGAVVTPAYLMDGFSVCFGTLTLGPALLLLSLAGAALIRTMSRPAA